MKTHTHTHTHTHTQASTHAHTHTVCAHLHRRHTSAYLAQNTDASELKIEKAHVSVKREQEALVALVRPRQTDRKKEFVCVCVCVCVGAQHILQRLPQLGGEGCVRV